LAKRDLADAAAAAGDPPVARPRADLAGIQYLRGVAATLVVVYHVFLQMGAATAGASLETFRAGVDIFFVISGFIMVYSTGCGAGTTPLQFLRRRIVRIVPLYWAMTLFMIAVLVFAPQFVKTSKLAWDHALASLAFVARLNPATSASYIPLVTPGWTLNLEMMFYAVFTLALLVAGSGARLILAASLPIVLLAAIGLTADPPGFAGFYTDPIILEFVFGMVVGLLFMRGRIRLSLVPATMLGVLALALLLIPPESTLVPRPVRFGLPALAVVVAALAPGWPKVPALHRLGDASYSLYLTHFFVLSALVQLWRRLHLFAMPGGALLLFPVGLVACIAVGVLSWRYVETPLTALAKRWLDQPGAKPVTLRAV